MKLQARIRYDQYGYMYVDRVSSEWIWHLLKPIYNDDPSSLWACVVMNGYTYIFENMISHELFDMSCMTMHEDRFYFYVELSRFPAFLRWFYEFDIAPIKDEFMQKHINLFIACNDIEGFKLLYPHIDSNNHLRTFCEIVKYDRGDMLMYMLKHGCMISKRDMVIHGIRVAITYECANCYVALRRYSTHAVCDGS